MSSFDRVRTSVLTLTVSAALVACDGGDRDRSGGAEEDLAGLPGVASAEVGEQLVDQDESGTVVVVDVEQDITVEQLTEVFVAVDGLAPHDWILSVDCGPASWEDTRERDDCDIATGAAATASGTPEQGAEVLLAAARALPEASVSVAWRREVRLQLDDPGPDAVAAALGVVLSDPVLRTTGGITVAAAAGSDEPGFLVTSDGLTSARTLALWRSLRPSLDELPAATPGAYTVAVDELERETVTALVQLPGVVLPEDLTPVAYGAALWPYLHAQLDVLDDRADEAPDGVRYAARNAYRPVLDARPAGNDPFLTLTLGQPGKADALGRPWSTEASEYVARRQGGPADH